jgi:hypothetical protein
MNRWTHLSLTRWNVRILGAELLPQWFDWGRGVEGTTPLCLGPATPTDLVAAQRRLRF